MNIAIILNSGVGSRLNAKVPKQYIKIFDQSSFFSSVIKFANHAQIDFILPVINNLHYKFYQAELLNFPNQVKLKLIGPAYGANTRGQSVYNGLIFIEKFKPTNVFIHDSVRPFFKIELLDKMLNSLKNNLAVIPVCPVQDSLKLLNENNQSVKNSVLRKGLYHAQTPQGFDYLTIKKIYDPLAEFTDDSEFCEKKSIEVDTILSDHDNFKITTKQDLIRAQNMIKNYEYRIGQGFDAHRFDFVKNEKNYIMLGGIKVPYSYKLIAHSDGDVVLHALTDAMLGSIAAGDIGQHFPPSDLAWKNTDSKQFIIYALRLIRNKQSIIMNVDITIIAEKPAISPYRKNIQENIASMLEINVNRVNIKATTTEKMGFTGRNEGIVAQAVISIKSQITEC